MDGLEYYLKKENVFFLLLAIILLYNNQNIYPQELQREYRSAYFLGRGDAGIAAASGEDAIFYNPAGIAQTHSLFKGVDKQSRSIFNEFILASPQIEGTQNINDLYNNYNNNESALQLLSQNQNSVYSAAAQNFSGIIFKRVSLGVMDRASGNAYEAIDTSKGISNVNIYAANRAGIYLTLAHDFFNERLFIGINGKYIQKKEINLNLSVLEAESQLSNNSFSKIINNSLNQGSGVGADVGMIYVLDKESMTQIGLVYRNIGMQYRWTTPEGSAAPTAEPTVVDVGVNTSAGTNKSKFIFAADFRDVANVQNAVVGKRIHLGLEYSFLDTFGLMGGLNQEYPTVGVFWHSKIIKIEGGMYTEEIGTSLGEYPSQRIFARIILGWLL